MLQVFKERYLTDGSRGHAVVLLLEADLLDGDGLAGQCIDGFVYYTVRTFTQFLLLLILIKALNGTLADSAIGDAVEHGSSDVSFGVVPDGLC